MGSRVRTARATALALALLAIPAATAGASQKAGFPGLQKRLVGQSKKLVVFTKEFKADAERYNRLAAATGYDYARLWRTKQAQVKPLLADMKRDWLEHNSDYERMEGIVAGTPSLVQYDVDIDAGASFKEDPKGAVSFSLKAPDGRTFKQPGALYNITEAALWGEDRSLVAKGVKPDLDGDGKAGEFGEALPDADFLRRRRARVRRQTPQAARRSATAYKPNTDRRAHRARRDGADDVRVLRRLEELALRRRRQGEETSFVVASRLNDIPTSSAASRSSTTDVRPQIAKVDPDQAAQTRRELDGLAAFIEKIYATRGAAASGSPPQDADTLGDAGPGSRRQAIAGQVSQAAAKLGIKVGAGLSVSVRRRPAASSRCSPRWPSSAHAASTPGQAATQVRRAPRQRRARR